MYKENKAGTYIIMWREKGSQFQRAVFIDSIERAHVKILAASIAEEEGTQEAVIYETIDHWRVLFNHAGQEVQDKDRKGAA